MACRIMPAGHGYFSAPVGHPSRKAVDSLRGLAGSKSPKFIARTNDPMKKILLVDSAIVFFERHKNLLHRNDITVFSATTGEEALAIHRKELVDLIIADLDTAGLTGDVLCARVRGMDDLRKVSIILICHDVPAEIERVAASGANAWVTRPIRPERLVDCVGQFLDVAMRKGYRVLLKAKVQGEKGEETFFCTSQNISNTGILIETDKRLAKGELIACTFFLPGARQVVADGEVVRSAEMPGDVFQYGIRFTSLVPEHRREIEKFVSSVARNGQETS
jgi:CheY-like chemotaxis protein